MCEECNEKCFSCAVKVMYTLCYATVHAQVHGRLYLTGLEVQMGSMEVWYDVTRRI